MNLALQPKIILITTLSTFTLYNLFYFGKKFYTFYLLINNMSKNQDQAQVYDNYIEIPYKHMNINYKVRLPYNNRLSFKMLPFTVVAIKGNNSFDITKEAGLPYLITPYDLGADCIITYNEEDEQEDYYYNQIMPFYLKCE